MSAIIDSVIGCCNAVISAIGFILQAVILLLPNSPFQFLMDIGVIDQYSDYLGWIIPIPQMLSALELWGTAIIGYYCYQAVLRWIKMIE